MSRVIHFEIHADDPERAQKFYGDLFGWLFTRLPGPQDYWLITTGAADEPGIDGGLLPRQGPPPTEGQAVSGYACTIGVDSVDETAEKITTAGGKICVEKMPVPGIGWLAYAQDPEGNIFGIHQEDAAAK